MCEVKRDWLFWIFVFGKYQILRGYESFLAKLKNCSEFKEYSIWIQAVFEFGSMFFSLARKRLFDSYDLVDLKQAPTQAVALMM